jgi:hypothetical protein
MPRAYVPEAGDIDWLNFTQAGHEQAGHRPALGLSPRAYNQKTKPDGLLSDDDADQELSSRSGDCEYDPLKCRAC